MLIDTLATWHDLVRSRDIKGLAGAVLEFQVEIDCIAVSLIHQKMAAMLQANQ